MRAATLAAGCLVVCCLPGALAVHTSYPPSSIHPTIGTSTQVVGLGCSRTKSSCCTQCTLIAFSHVGSDIEGPHLAACIGDGHIRRDVVHDLVDHQHSAFKLVRQLLQHGGQLEQHGRALADALQAVARSQLAEHPGDGVDGQQTDLEEQRRWPAEAASASAASASAARPLTANGMPTWLVRMQH
eukprot:366410-Chlamydomonas_euryale.AAC.37